jgi:hypothetical protein
MMIMVQQDSVVVALNSCSYEQVNWRVEFDV